MVQYLPSNSNVEGPKKSGNAAHVNGSANDDLSDLRIFWGPEFCRLEYLLHLMITGRIKDAYLPTTA